LVRRRSRTGNFFSSGAAASKSPIDFAIQISRAKSDSLISFSVRPPALPNQPPHREQWPGRACAASVPTGGDSAGKSLPEASYGEGRPLRFE
jgi:hypothetical protein